MAERVQRQHGGAVVVHEVPPDLIRAVGQPGWKVVTGGSQQQSRSLNRASGQDNQRRRHALRRAVLLETDGLDPTFGACFQLRDQAPGAQFDIRVLQCLNQADGFGIHLATTRIGMRIPWGLSEGQPSVDIDAKRQVAWRQPDPLQPRLQVRNVRLVRNRFKCIVA